MQAQEYLDQLRRQKTPYSTEELWQRGWQRYTEIREELEAQHYGEFVMIDVDSDSRCNRQRAINLVATSPIMGHDDFCAKLSPAPQTKGESNHAPSTVQ